MIAWKYSTYRKDHVNKVLLLAASILLYYLSFILLSERVGAIFAALSSIPIAFAGLLFGRKGGIVTWAALVVISELIFEISGLLELNTMLHCWPGILACLITGLVTGHLSDLKKDINDRAEELQKEQRQLKNEVNARIKAEKAAQLTELLLRLGTDASELGIYMANKYTGEILYFNDQFLRIWKLEEYRDRIISGTFTDKQLVQHCSTQLEKRSEDCPLMMKEDEFARTENELYLKGGRVIKRTSAPVKDPQGHYLGRFCLLEDITCQKENEMKLHALNLHLEDKVRERTMELEKEMMLNRLNQQELLKSLDLLKISQAQNNAYLKAIPDLMFKLSEDGRFLDYSASYTEKLWIKPSDFMNRRLRDVLPPELAFRAEEKIRLANSANEVQILEAETEINGLKYYQEDRFIPMGNGEVLVLVRDLTEKKNIEAALRESEEKFRKMIENSSDMIILVSQGGKINYVSNSYCKITGYRNSDVVGLSILQHVHPDDVNLAEEIYNRIAAGNHTETISSMRYLYKDKSVHYLDVLATNQLKEEPVWSVVLNLRDVTEKKLMEMELEKHRLHLEEEVEKRTVSLNELNKRLITEIHKVEEREDLLHSQLILFQMLLDTAPIPILIQDMEGRNTDCNRAFEVFSGLKKEVITGKHPDDLPWRVGDNSELIDEIRGLTDNVQTAVETTLITAEQTVKDVIIYKALFSNHADKPAGIISMYLDISERKKTERELLFNLEKEKELNEMKTRFVSTVSHEFRNPLATIQSAADLLGHFGPGWDKERFSGQIGIINCEIEQLTGLMNDILTINRAETGKLSFQTESINVEEFIKSLTEEVSSAYRSCPQIELSFNASEKNYYLDKKLLKFILGNLLSNAIKYTPENGKVIIQVFRKAGFLYFKVSDTGIGIAREDLENIFTPFFRGRNSSDIPGTGLGLSILKKAVEVHKGEVSCRSRLNNGSVFMVKIPIPNKLGLNDG